MLSLQGITYIHTNGDILFSNIHLTVNTHEKVALIGNNGQGKSTLMKIMAGMVIPNEGVVVCDGNLYSVPQLLGQFNRKSIGEVLGVHEKLKALREILKGYVTETNLEVLDNDWSLEERCAEAFAQWGLKNISLDQSMDTLSGGEKTKLLLSGISIHQPDHVLLDEPSNHLDGTARDLLYDFLSNINATVVVISHDRQLLKIVDKVNELGKHGITTYGGNYDFYVEQKAIEQNALADSLKEKEKALRKAKAIERESIERQEKLNARGKRKQESAGLPRIMMNTFRNNAEKSTARLQNNHTEKIDSVSKEISELRDQLPDLAKMKWDLRHSTLHEGKVLIDVDGINVSFNRRFLWRNNLTFQIRSGDRIALAGDNGSGKTTLLKIILDQRLPDSGMTRRNQFSYMYVDQDYSIIDRQLTVFEQALQYNAGGLHEHEIKIRLNRFLFGKEDWGKRCGVLSGGEKMRLVLCTLTISAQAPDMIVLDEPTNNLDLTNVSILVSAIRSYRGTLIVVSHDKSFLNEIDIRNTLLLDGK